MKRMTDEKLQFLTALVAGYEERWLKKNGVRNLPVDFLEDHNALQEIIDKFDLDEMKQYIHLLSEGATLGWLVVGVMLRASCAFKCKCIIRVKGLWDYAFED